MRTRRWIPVSLWALIAILPSASDGVDPFPVPIEALEEKGREKVEGLLRDHTLSRSPRMEHPILNRPLHQFLLDRPDVGAVLARILHIGTYTITPTGTDQFRASDPEGLEGEMEILYRDAVSRIYFAQGVAEGGILRVRGKVVVCQQSRYWIAEGGQERVESQLTIYAKLENPVLAFLVRILSPFIGSMVDAKISKAQGVVRQVSEVMVASPYETYTRIAESEQLSSEDLTTLRALMRVAEPSPTGTDLP